MRTKARSSAGPHGKAKADRHFVTALARGLDVLHAFKSGEERLSNQDLAQRCSLPKSTVTRLTYTLTKLGHLHRVAESGRYRLGLATLSLGGTTLSHLDVKETSNPLLQELADVTRTMVSLGIRDDLSMLYIESCRSQASIVTLQLGIGSRLPIATTAIGRGYLAAAPVETRQAIEDRIEALDPLAWPRIEAGIRQAIADLAQRGCVGSFGDWKKEIHAIAVPMTLGPGLPPMVVSAAAPAHAVSVDTFLSEIRPQLIQTVHGIQTRYRSST